MHTKTVCVTYLLVVSFKQGKEIITTIFVYFLVDCSSLVTIIEQAFKYVVVLSPSCYCVSFRCNTNFVLFFAIKFFGPILCTLTKNILTNIKCCWYLHIEDSLTTLILNELCFLATRCTLFTWCERKSLCSPFSYQASWKNNRITRWHWRLVTFLYCNSFKFSVWK